MLVLKSVCQGKFVKSYKLESEAVAARPFEVTIAQPGGKRPTITNLTTKSIISKSHIQKAHYATFPQLSKLV